MGGKHNKADNLDTSGLSFEDQSSEALIIEENKRRQNLRN